MKAASYCFFVAQGVTKIAASGPSAGSRKQKCLAGIGAADVAEASWERKLAVRSRGARTC